MQPWLALAYVSARSPRRKSAILRFPRGRAKPYSRANGPQEPRLGGVRRVRTRMRARLAATTLLTLGLATLGAARAEDVADFYRGKQIKIVVGGTAEGGYAPYARMLQLHMGQYIPGNPQPIVQFMPGAGGLVATNNVANVAPRDGTVIGSVQRNVVRLFLFGDPGVKYDPGRLNWLGSLYNDVSVCVAWHTTGMTDIRDAMQRELIVGGTGHNDTEQFPAVLNAVLGTKFKIITGYSGAGGINLALERGEVQGRCGWSWDSLKSQKGEWLREGKLNILAQLALKRTPEIGSAPLVTELATSQDQRDVLELIFGEQVLGKPFVLAGGVPAERL